ncbi:MAG: hypothetical protein U5R31_03485 [Acidimicrobiia bacterium]|nr:hypothetical protein [Acidimicrobiia bacterium]
MGDRLDRLGDGRLLEVDPRALGHRRPRDLQQQGMSGDQAVHPLGPGPVEAEVLEQLEGRRFLQRVQLDRPDGGLRRGRRPPGRRRQVPTGRDQSGVRREPGHEVLAQPGVDQSEGLEPVDGQHHPVAEPGQRLDRARGVVVSDGLRQRLDEPPRRRLDLAGVELDHRRPAVELEGERLEQRGLAHAAEPVDEDDQRAVVAEDGPEHRQLARSAHRAAYEGRATSKILDRAGVTHRSPERSGRHPIGIRGPRRGSRPRPARARGPAGG